jgi:hypothetical protein
MFLLTTDIQSRLFSLPTPTRCKPRTTMNIHAQALLSAAQSWNWPPVKYIQESGDQSITPKLLSCFIEPSHAYPDSQLVDQFWFNVQRGHTGLETNSKLKVLLAMNQKHHTEYRDFIAVEKLKTLAATNVSQQAGTLKILFQKIDPEEVDFSFVRHFSTELLAHLGITCTY